MRQQKQIGYDKDALSMFHKQNYLESLKGHTEFTSANALRNSVKLAINLDSKTDRFKMEKKGGHFAVTAAVPSSFDKKVSNAYCSIIFV